MDGKEGKDYDGKFLSAMIKALVILELLAKLVLAISQL